MPVGLLKMLRNVAVKKRRKPIPANRGRWLSSPCQFSPSFPLSCRATICNLITFALNLQLAVTIAGKETIGWCPQRQWSSKLFGNLKREKRQQVRAGLQGFNFGSYVQFPPLTCLLIKELNVDIRPPSCTHSWKIVVSSSAETKIARGNKSQRIASWFSLPRPQFNRKFKVDLQRTHVLWTQ